MAIGFDHQANSAVVLRFNCIKTGFTNTFTPQLSPIIHHIPLQSETAASTFPKLCVQCITTSVNRPFFILLYAYRLSWVYLPMVELGAVDFPCRVYKAPWSSQELRWNPPLNSMKLSLSQLVSLSFPLFFESCRLQCKSKGFSIQVYPSLSLLKCFPRLRRSLGSQSSLSHRFWMSGAPLSICCTNL